MYPGWSLYNPVINHVKLTASNSPEVLPTEISPPPQKKCRKGVCRVGFFQVRASGFREEIKQVNHFVQNTKGDCGEFF